jgi:hypothetical protein
VHHTGLSDVSAYRTDLGVWVTEDFWFIEAIIERRWTRNPEHQKMTLTDKPCFKVVSWNFTQLLPSVFEKLGHLSYAFQQFEQWTFTSIGLRQSARFHPKS